MDKAEVHQQLGIGRDGSRGEDALHQRIPIADLHFRRAIVALLGIGREVKRSDACALSISRATTAGSVASPQISR